RRGGQLSFVVDDSTTTTARYVGPAPVRQGRSGRSRSPPPPPGAILELDIRLLSQVITVVSRVEHGADTRQNNLAFRMEYVIRVMRRSPREACRARPERRSAARWQHEPGPRLNPGRHRPRLSVTPTPVPTCELYHRSGASLHPRRATRSGCQAAARKRSRPSDRHLQQHAATSAHECRPGQGRAGAVAARQDFHLSLGSGRVAPGPGPAAVRWWPRPVRDRPVYALGQFTRERTAGPRREFRPSRDSSIRIFVL
ncbi:MAG: hypothetical protein QOF99_6310, partial [Pseudonocardiales bacterium]|nr:hypothetical protein [Pseudonocardiales bacterium]